MRGLAVFISDLRNARARETEERRINTELAKIRSKFKDHRLSGYDRKKYVCKLLYMYILGWDVSFGHLEAVNLISSNRYSEKQIGYLGVTLFLNEHHDLLHLVVNSLKKDLLDSNDLFNCLALHCIANVGGKEMGDALAGDVYQLLISPSSNAGVKKKAALALLRLCRKQTGIVQEEWFERIVILLDEVDIGVALSASSLISSLSCNFPLHLCGSAYMKAIQRLELIIIHQVYHEGDVYYKTPAPWLQVKLLRLLRTWPIAADPVAMSTLGNVLNKIVETSQEPVQNIQQSNARNAVLFEAIALSIHIGADSALTDRAMLLLGKFISSKETNARYLGLETMVCLAGRVDLLEPLKRHQNTILQSLKDRDISVRRRALDLLYSMCDSTNARVIVAELVKFLQNADYAIRQELVLKIAILVEKHTTAYEWYITVTLQMLSIAGDHASDEVWQRIVQVVTNNEELQEQASRQVLQYLKSTSCHENVVRVGGYVLGEFGHLIANSPGCSPIEQFSTLHSKFNISNSNTRALLLSTYIKFVNLFPEIRAEILLVFAQHSQIIDPELQQRACEYMTLATMEQHNLLETLCEEMPPFPERKSLLISRLGRSISDLPDVPLGVNKSQQRRSMAAGTPSLMNRSSQTPNAQGDRALMEKQEEGNDLVTQCGQFGHNTFGETKSSDKERFPCAVNSASAPEYLWTGSEPLLCENFYIKISLHFRYDRRSPSLLILYHNLAALPLTLFTSSIATSTNALHVNCANTLENTIPPSSSVQKEFSLEAFDVFDNNITLRTSFLADTFHSLSVGLPVSICTFMEQVVLSGAAFFDRWIKLAGAPFENQDVVSVRAPPNHINTTQLISLVAGQNWGMLKHVDPNPANLVGAGVLHLTKLGKVGVLLRLEPSGDYTLFRITIRGTNKETIAALQKIMVNAISRLAL